MSADEVPGLGLAEAIRLIRDDLTAAQAAGAGQEILLPVESLTVELHVAATRTGEGKAGFKVPFINAEVGGRTGWERESVQTVTVTFGAPVDRTGQSIKVTRASDKPRR